MIRVAKNSALRHALYGSLIVLGLSLSAHAADSASVTGLGQSWPNASDISTSPRWHVYAFQRDGIRYIQVNDLNGKVRAALAVAGNEFLVLPMGSDAARVNTPTTAATTITAAKATTASAGEQVYNDGSMQLYVLPRADGSASLSASNCSGDLPNCGVHSNALKLPIDGMH